MSLETYGLYDRFGTTEAAMMAEWRRMLRFFKITDDSWPFGGVTNWKQQLHSWIEEHVDDICEQRPMHEMVSKW